jgi:hypothetical protein
MNELDRYGASLPSLMTPGGRALARDLASVRRATTVALAKGDGLTAFTEQAMNNLASLDRHRRLLSQGDEVLDSVLRQVEAGCLLNVVSEQSSMFRRY